MPIGTAPDDMNNSSILDTLGKGPDSSLRMDSFASGSHVDLLGHLRPKRGSSGKMPSTDPISVRRPPPTLADDDESFMGGELADDDDSSTVDLGSQPLVDMPFPLGVDSSVGSDVVARQGASRPDRGPRR